MRPSSVIACLATIGVVVPSGWHLLDADIRTDGPAVRAASQSLKVGDATVTLELDRGVMPAGGTMSVTLVATADTPKNLELDLTALEDNGMGGERTPNPPTVIERRVVTVHAEVGGGPPVVASFKLGSKRAGKGRLEWFDIVATPFSRHDKPSDRYGQRTDAAIVGLATWTGNTFPITIEPPAKLPVDGPFTVAVRVKNTTAKPFHNLYAQFEGGTIDSYEPMGGGIQVASDQYDIALLEQPAIETGVETDDHDGTVLAAGAERLYIYSVTPRHPGVTHFTFVARASANDNGAFETLQLDRPEPPAPSIAVK